MTKIVIHDLEVCEQLERTSLNAVRGGRFGALFATPYEMTRGSSGGSTTIINFLIDEFVSNTVNQITVQNISVTDVVNSAVTIDAPQTVSADQTGTITASAGNAFAQLPV